MTNKTINQIATVFSIDAEALNSKPKLRRRGSIIKEFSLNTSTHGIPGIARSQSIHNRLFWIASLLMFAGIMMYFVIQAIRTYFQYPSQTSISIVVEWPQAFPAVTICNYSPLVYNRFIGPFRNYTKTLNLINTTNVTKFTYEESLYIQDFLIYKLNRNESLNEYFYPLDSMMMLCTYNGMTCTSANFTWFISPLYGLCYTFNAKLKDTTNNTLKYNADNGQMGLLDLRLYVHPHQYVPYMSKGIGMVVLVHDNIQLPYIELVSMQLGPGRHHRLGYAKKTSLFLPAPYTTCNDKVNLGMQTVFNEHQNTDYGYTQSMCYYACMQAYAYQKCGCGNPFRWTGRSIVLPGTDKATSIPLCNVTDPCYGRAGAEIMNTESIWLTYCPDCTQECSFSEFILKSTSLLAPPPFLTDTIKAFVEKSTIPLSDNWTTSWASEIQSGYVSLEVAYETTRTEIYSEQATLMPVDVISNVGGQTGLWIGISFLSLMEIAEMTYRLLRFHWHYLRIKIQKKFTPQETGL